MCVCVWGGVIRGAVHAQSAVPHSTGAPRPPAAAQQEREGTRLVLELGVDVLSKSNGGDCRAIKLHPQPLALPARGGRTPVCSQG